MTTATSKPAIVNGNIYTTEVTKNSDGSLYTVQKSGDRVVRTIQTTQNTNGTFSSTYQVVDATPAEQVALDDPNSSLRLASTSMVKDAQSQIEGSTGNPQQNKAYDQASGGSGNAATTATNPDAQAGSTPTNAPPQSQTQSPAGEILFYPVKMEETQQDRIKFTAVEYIPTGNLQAGTISSQNRTSSQGKKQLGSVFLPVQAGISDFNSVEWTTGGLNEIERLALNTALKAMNAKGPKEFGTAFGEAYTKGLNDLKNSQKEVQVAFAEQATGIQNLLSNFGSVLNPNLELLFTGPSIRPFDFTFRMSAREKREADNIKKIINFFKRNMAAKKSDGTAIFLKAPNTFLIEYKYNGSTELHPGINKIKECALVSCSVQYAPNGTYMTYPDGTMVSYSMTLSFQELEPIYDTDYDTHPIGY